MPEVEDVKEVQTEASKWQHPLLSKKVSNHNYRWDNWLEDWGKARDSKVLMNLLHIGFDVDMDREHEWEDRIIFYLEVAHSYYDGNLQDFNLEDHDAGEVRRKIARKAWNVLCQRVFKNSQGESEFPEWGRAILNEKVFPKIIWFFSFEDNIPRAFKDDHDLEIARKFLLRLVKMLWEDFGWGNPKPSFIEENRVALLRIAFELGVLDEFSSRSVSEEDIKILEGFTLKNRYDWKPDYESLEEVAVSATGQNQWAAKTILVWRILRRERSRQKSVLAKARAKAVKAREDFEYSKNRILEIEKVLDARDLPVDRTKLRKELRDLKDGLAVKDESLRIAKEELKPIQEKYGNTY